MLSPPYARIRASEGVTSIVFHSKNTIYSLSSYKIRETHFKLAEVTANE